MVARAKINMKNGSSVGLGSSVTTKNCPEPLQCEKR
jgi:hypothetical protein